MHAYPLRMTVRRFTGVMILLVGLLASAFAQTPVGTVEFVSGDVRVNGEFVDFGDVVGAGDWVQTGSDGEVDVVFDSVNIFRLGPNTVAVLNLGESRQSVDLKVGTFAAVFDRVRTLSGRGTFDIMTPTTAGGVRGTSFFMNVIDSETTYVCTCNGILEYSPSGADSFLDRAAEHSAYYMRRGEDGIVSVERAPEVFHSNAALNQVAAQIDLIIPWGVDPE